MPMVQAGYYNLSQKWKMETCVCVNFHFGPHRQLEQTASRVKDYKVTIFVKDL